METLNVLLSYLERKGLLGLGRMLLGLSLPPQRNWNPDTRKLRVIPVILVFDTLHRYHLPTTFLTPHLTSFNTINLHSSCSNNYNSNK
jgi:hypothetical protein